MEESKEKIGKFIAYLLDYDYQFTVDGCSAQNHLSGRDEVGEGPSDHLDKNMIQGYNSGMEINNM